MLTLFMLDHIMYMYNLLLLYIIHVLYTVDLYTTEATVWIQVLLSIWQTLRIITYHQWSSCVCYAHCIVCRCMYSAGVHVQACGYSVNVQLRSSSWQHYMVEQLYIID